MSDYFLHLFQDENERLSFPPWVLAFTNLSHLLVTFASSANFYIYFAKYGGKSVLQLKRNSRCKSNFSQNRRFSRHQANNQMKVNSASQDYVDCLALTRSTTPRLAKRHRGLEAHNNSSSQEKPISPIIVHKSSGEVAILTSTSGPADV